MNALALALLQVGVVRMVEYGASCIEDLVWMHMVTEDRRQKEGKVKEQS